MDGVEEEQQLEAIEVEALLTAIATRYGYDFRGYARPSLLRRIRQALKKEALPNLSALQERLLRDRAALRRFVDRLCVHTSAMFRDPEFYLSLRRDVVPLLRTYPFIRIWHAGCAGGEEVYSLAILLEEEGLYDRCRIYATDLSETTLERARKGIFPLRAMQDYTLGYQRAGGRESFSSYYIADESNVVFRSSLTRNVVFSQHNLACDGVFNDFQLVLCRNVLIYFDDELRDRVHELLYASLTGFGILGLGKKESLEFTKVIDRYRELPANIRLYRRGP